MNSAAAATTTPCRCCSTGTCSTAARAAPPCARPTRSRGAPQTQLSELTQQVQLEVQQSLDRLNTSADSLATAEARSEAARAGFRIASRKRDEGVISQVEFIDARSNLTGAELNLNVTRFEVLARQAELDYATAAGTLPLDCFQCELEPRWYFSAISHRRLRQERCSRRPVRPTPVRIQNASQGPAVPPIDTNGTGGHQERDAPVIQDGWRRAPHPRAGRRRGQAGAARSRKSS